MAQTFKSKTLLGRSGIFSHEVIAPNLIYNTGDQTISGNKNFTQNVIVGDQNQDNLFIVSGNDISFGVRPTVNGTGVLLSGEAASLPTTIVYTTGDQIISGNKSFGGYILLSGNFNRIGLRDYIEVDGDFVYIRREDQTLLFSSEESSLYDANGIPSVRFDSRTLTDGNYESINWNSRFLANQNETPVLTWTGDNIGIGTNTPSEKLQIIGNIKASGASFTNTPTVNGTNVLLSGEAITSGDLTGHLPYPTINKLQGYKLDLNGGATDGQTLQWNAASSSWRAGAIPAGGNGGGGLVYYFDFANRSGIAPTGGLPTTGDHALSLLGREYAVGSGQATSNELDPRFVERLLCSFVTASGSPQVTNIPAGLWDFNIWASVDSASAIQCSIRAVVNIYNPTYSTYRYLASTDNVYLYETDTIAQYILNATVPQTGIANNERIYIQFFGKKYTTNNRAITLYFDSYRPSHVHTTIPSVAGDGVVKVINGVFQTPATGIFNQDVDNNANIAQSKIANLTTDLNSLRVSGETLDSKINTFSGTYQNFVDNLDLTYATDLQLSNTESTLDNKINNLSGYINSPASNIVFTTGNQNISGNKTFINNLEVQGTGIFNALDLSNISDFSFSGVTINLINSTVQSSGQIYISGNPVLTGSSTLYATSANLASTGSTLATNLASTGSNLDTKINNLSGVSVLTFGNQTINGLKTFTSGIDIYSSTSPQSLRIFNSTGINSGEFGLFGWQNNNQLVIGSQATSSGIVRDTIITGASVSFRMNQAGGGQGGALTLPYNSDFNSLTFRIADGIGGGFNCAQLKRYIGGGAGGGWIVNDSIGFTNNINTNGAVGGDVFLTRGGPNILNQFSSTNPQQFRVFNFSGINTGEFGLFGWVTGLSSGLTTGTSTGMGPSLVIGSQNTSSGILRDVIITGSNIHLIPSGGGTINFYTGNGIIGSQIRSDGGLYFSQKSIVAGSTSSIYTDIQDVLYIDANMGGGKYIRIGRSPYYLDVQNSYLGYTSSSNSFRLSADGSNVLSLRNGANPNTFRVYNATGTNSGEYGLFGWQNNQLVIGSQATSSGIFKDTIITGNNIYLGTTGSNFVYIKNTLNLNDSSSKIVFNTQQNNATNTISVNGNGSLTFTEGPANGASNSTSYIFNGKNWTDGTTLDVQRTSTSLFTVRSLGNVGIGITNPSGKLSVSGDIRNYYGNSTNINSGEYGLMGWVTGVGINPYLVIGAQQTTSGILRDLTLTGNNININGSGDFNVFDNTNIAGNLNVTGNILLSGNQVLTGSSTLYATSANLASTGSTLDTKINTLSGYVTGANATFASITNLASTGSTLDTNLASTGSTLDTKINNLSGVSVLTTTNQNIFGDKRFEDKVYINNLYVTGSETILNTISNNISSPYLILNLTGGLNDGGIFFVTGAGLTGVNDTGVLFGFDNITKTWHFGIGTRLTDVSTLDEVMGYHDLTGYSGYANLNVYSTGSTLNTKIDNLSGYINSPSSNIVFTTGNQIISGNKTFLNNIQVSGTGIFNAVDFNNIDIISLSGVDISITNANVALTNRPTVNGTGVLLSGEASAITLPTTIVYTTGDQIISGNKTFISGVTFSGQNINIIDASLNLSGVGDMTFEGTNINFINSPVFISGTNLRVVGDVIANNLVYTTGNQIISGVKTFATGVNISGNVGIGTITPFAKLHIAGSPALLNTTMEDILYLQRPFNAGVAFGSRAALRLGKYTTDSSQSFTRLDIALRSGSDNTAIDTPPEINVMTLRADGNVGIGTTTPSERLTVIGNASISGNTTISGSINISGDYDIYSQLENAKKLAIAYAIAL